MRIQLAVPGIVMGLCLGCDSNGTDASNDGGIWDTGIVTDGGADSDKGNVDTETSVCTSLFGMPNDATGLDSTQCAPSCPCEGFEPPRYSEEAIATLIATEHLNPLPLLDSDPYEGGAAVPDPVQGVCGLLPDGTKPRAYRLETFSTAADATAAGATITHTGSCGLCSSLANLAVYIRIPDLTEPVRACGVLGMFRGEEANMNCLRELGFEEACAQIWYYNTVNTRTHCQSICTQLMTATYHSEDGAPNECLQCDEDNSGPIFKKVAGRTRRNSGLPTAICRPCDTVAPIVHDYF